MKHIKHRRQLKTLDESRFYSGPEAYRRFEDVMRRLLTVSKEELDEARREYRKHKQSGERRT